MSVTFSNSRSVSEFKLHGVVGAWRGWNATWVMDMLGHGSQTFWWAESISRRSYEGKMSSRVMFHYWILNKSLLAHIYQILPRTCACGKDSWDLSTQSCLGNKSKGSGAGCIRFVLDSLDGRTRAHYDTSTIRSDQIFLSLPSQGNSSTWFLVCPSSTS